MLNTYSIIRQTVIVTICSFTLTAVEFVQAQTETNPILKIGIVQRFGERPQDRLTLKAPSGQKLTLSFSETDICGLPVEDKFDMIVFAASIQYFSSFEKMIREALLLLKKGGEIHILDSFFYKNGKINEAKQRSLLYYRSIGFEQMAEDYFHHSAESLHLFDTKLLFDPASIKNKYFGKKDPFPWICIKAS